MAEKNRVNVQIQGINFKIVGYDDEDYILEVINKLNDRIDQIQDKNKNLSGIEAVILAAINLEDQLLKERNNTQEINDSLALKDQLQKMDDYDQLTIRLEKMKLTQKENEMEILKLKNAEKFASDSLKRETEKYQNLYQKYKSLDERYKTKSEDNEYLANRVKIQERLNCDRNLELLKANKETMMLRREREQLVK